MIAILKFQILIKSFEDAMSDLYDSLYFSDVSIQKVSNQGIHVKAGNKSPIKKKKKKKEIASTKQPIYIQKCVCKQQCGE